MRVFFDASVVIAALLSPKGGSSYLFRYIELGIIVGITSQTVLDEILEEDKPEKLKRTKEQIEEFIAQSGLIIVEHITHEDIALHEGRVDTEDAHLIAGAHITKCSHLVSLDKKHILHPEIKQRFHPLKILSPKELLEEILA